MLLVVGPVKAERGDRGWRVGLNRSLAAVGGLAVSVPGPAVAADPERVRAFMRRVVLGGPLASVAFAVAAAGAAALAARGGGGLAALLASMLAFTAVVSGAIALGTLLPSRLGGFASDGRRALDLRPGAPAAEHAFDRSQVAEGRAHLARALALRAGYPAIVRPALLLQGAWAAAWYDGDVAAASALADEAVRLGPGLDLAPHLRPMAEAALAWRRGDGDAARRALAEARAALAAAPAIARYGLAPAREALDALAAALDGAPVQSAELPVSAGRA